MAPCNSLLALFHSLVTLLQPPVVSVPIVGRLLVSASGTGSDHVTFHALLVPLKSLTQLVEVMAYTCTWPWGSGVEWQWFGCTCAL